MTNQNYAKRVMNALYANAGVDSTDTEAKIGYLMAMTGNRAREYLWTKTVRGKRDEAVEGLEQLALDEVHKNLTQGQREALLVSSFRLSKPESQQNIAGLVGRALEKTRAYAPRAYTPQHKRPSFTQAYQPA